MSTQEELMDFVLQVLFGEMAKNRPFVAVVLVIAMLVAIFLLKLLVQYVVDGWKSRRDALIAGLTADRSDLRAELAGWRQRAIASSSGEVRSLREELARAEEMLNTSRERETELLRDRDRLEQENLTLNRRVESFRTERDVARAQARKLETFRDEVAGELGFTEGSIYSERNLIGDIQFLRGVYRNLRIWFEDAIRDRFFVRSTDILSRAGADADWRRLTELSGYYEDWFVRRDETED